MQILKVTSVDGRWITAYIEIDGIDLKDVDAESVQLLYDDNSVPADWGDVQEDGRLMVKFDRQAVMTRMTATISSRG